MSPQLKLFLLGAPRVELDGDHLDVRPRKALALLIYLAITANRHTRDALATLLWPNSDQRQARHALRNRLSELSLALGGDWIEADRERVGLRAGFWLDVTEFQQHLANEAADSQTLTAAADLYRDDFLTGFTLPDCPEFDEWQFFQNESLRHALASALEKLAVILSDQADYEPAISYARRRLALDPLHEPAHQKLIVLYAQAGQQAAALRQYQICLEMLEAELGVPPSEEITTLYRQIRAGRFGRKEDRQADEPSPPPLKSTQNRHNLPTQTTSFVGREAELAEIQRLLLDELGCRLLTLIGPGGTGKTRLALAVASQMLDVFSDGAYFVSLASVSENADIVPAIAEALRFTFYGQDDPKDQLLAYLGQKQLLLVVDNFEHLLDGADLMSEILGQAPEVTLLTTSRERLNLQEEWVYEVPGLAFPALKEETSEGLSSYSAIELFTQRARQTVPNFAPSEDEMIDIGCICQLVEGMPLGLELAAPWVRTLSCREVAAEIERSFDFLSTTLRNMPERHRSLRAIFEQTWGRLSEAEQAVLRQLSVFRGGSTRKAAEQVTDATLPVLSSLVDKALLRRTNTGRYELHELIRQFAETQLQTDSSAVEQVQKRHGDYFVAFLETRTAGVKGGRQKETLAEIKADMDNIRLAWRRAIANRDVEGFERAAECLFIFYLYSSGHYEGQIAFQQAVTAFADLSNVLKGYRAHELDALAYKQRYQAEQFLREALAIWQPITGQEAGMADVLRHLGQVLVSSGEHRRAEVRQYFWQALEPAIRYGLAPVALDVCLGVAQLLADTNQMEQSVELATLAEQHEASTFETKEKARQFLVELEHQMPSEPALAAQGRGQMQDLWATAQTLSVALAEDKPAKG